MEVELFECTHVTFNVFLQIQNGGFKHPNFYIKSKKCSGSENPNFILSGNKVGSKLSIFRKLLLDIRSILLTESRAVQKLGEQ